MDRCAAGARAGLLALGVVTELIWIVIASDGDFLDIFNATPDLGGGTRRRRRGRAQDEQATTASATRTAAPMMV